MEEAWHRPDEKETCTCPRQRTVPAQTKVTKDTKIDGLNRSEGSEQRQKSSQPPAISVWIYHPFPLVQKVCLCVLCDLLQNRNWATRPLSDFSNDGQVAAAGLPHLAVNIVDHLPFHHLNSADARSFSAQTTVAG